MVNFMLDLKSVELRRRGIMLIRTDSMCRLPNSFYRSMLLVVWMLVFLVFEKGDAVIIPENYITNDDANALFITSNDTKIEKETLSTERSRELRRDEHGDINVEYQSGKCNMTLSQNSVNHFRHAIYFSESSFAYIRLKPAPGSNVGFVETNNIVGETIWVWTYFGKDGSLEFLHWPMEFGIWSMGLLYTSTMYEPLPMELKNVSGNCANLRVGNETDNYAISNALKLVLVDLMEIDEKYGPSFFCYMSREFIESNFTYNLCKHIVCPIANIKYNCCSNFYNKTLGAREMVCNNSNGKVFEYDAVWWIFPVIVSIFLFAYSPILLAYIGYRLTCTGGKAVEIITFSSPQDMSLQNVVDNDEDEQNNTDELTSKQDFEEKHEILMSGYDHVTFIQTLMSPLRACARACTNSSGTPNIGVTILARLSRAVFPVLSLSLIGVQIFLDYEFLHGFVLEAMSKGVPMGFRSMLAGFDKCRNNFLPLFGGPFSAVGFYLLVTILLLVIPKSVIQLVTASLDVRYTASEPSLLCLNLRTISILSSIRLVKRRGYSLLYHWYLAQFYMLLNSRFWIRCLEIQVSRWRSFAQTAIYWLFIPFYVVLCFVELFLSVSLYTLPVFSFARIIIRSYIRPVFRDPHGRSVFFKVAYLFVWVILVVAVAFFLFMFCTIFLDATLFISRIIMFTFTGIIVYPKTAYGYLIFGFTVFYYLWESVGDFSQIYRQLFKDTLRAAESVQIANESNEQKRLVFKINGEKGICRPLFEFVIEVHRPRRKEVFLSCLKGGIVITFLAVMIHLLISTDKFQDLHVIMHVGTALFICAFPQIAKAVCRRKEDRRHVQRHRKRMQETVKQYIGYFVEEEDVSCNESE